VDFLALALRVLHILGAILWVGGSVLYLTIVEVLARRLPVDQAAKLISDIQLRSPAPIFFPVAGMLAVLPGIALYYVIDAATAYPGTETYGAVFHLSVLAALVALVLGIVSGSTGYRKLHDLARQYSQSPSPELRDQVVEQSRHVGRWNHIEVGFLAIAFLGMSSFRYL
jgi:uncharacterized membrane protein